MGFVLPKTPWLLKKAFSSYIWNVNEDEKTLYITLDDGPTPVITEKTLDILSDFDAKATFFCIGENVKKHPKIFQKVIAEGHSIGNHTYNHLKGWETDNEVYIENTLLAEKEIQEARGQGSEVRGQKEGTRNLKPTTSYQPSLKLFRPPYGRIGPLQGRMLQKQGYDIVMWDVVSYDWEPTISPEVCLDHVIDNAQSGSIVVFHDSVKASEKMLYALPKTLAFYKEKGFGFKAITADTLASTR